MPGPKQLSRAAVVGDGRSVVAELDVGTGGLELPSTEGYVTVVKRRTRLPDGSVREDEDRTWSHGKLTQWLALCPKVPVMVPIEPGESRDPKRAPILPVYYDGWRVDVPKGRSVMVALPIAEIILQAQETTRTLQARGVDIYLIRDPEERGYEIPSATS